MSTVCFIHTDADLRDHPNTGTGVWGGLSDGNPVEGETICPTYITGLRGHRDQSQPSCISVVEQHAEISSEYHPLTVQEKKNKPCLEHVYLWVWVLDLLYFAETHCCAIIIQKNYTDLVTDFLPATESPMSRLQRQIYCVCGRKWWVITLLIFSSRPPSPSTTLSHSDQGRFFFLRICKTWWMNGFICCLQAGLWFPLGFFWRAQPCWFGPILCFLRIDWVCCWNVHV